MVLDMRLTFGRNDGNAAPMGDDSFLVQFVSDKNPTIQTEEAEELFQMICPTRENFGIIKADIFAYPSPNVYQNFTAYQFRRDQGGKWQNEKMGGVYKTN